jgi:hypothetical protein
MVLFLVLGKVQREFGMVEIGETQVLLMEMMGMLLIDVVIWEARVNLIGRLLALRLFSVSKYTH